MANFEPTDAAEQILDAEMDKARGISRRQDVIDGKQVVLFVMTSRTEVSESLQREFIRRAGGQDVAVRTYVDGMPVTKLL